MTKIELSELYRTLNDWEIRFIFGETHQPKFFDKHSLKNLVFNNFMLDGFQFDEIYNRIHSNWNSYLIILDSDDNYCHEHSFDWFFGKPVYM